MPVSPAVQPLYQVTYLSLNAIRIDPDSPRHSHRPSTIAHLAEDIRRRGFIHPLVVRAEQNHFLLVQGQRRYLAAELLGLQHLPCLIIRAPGDAPIREYLTCEAIRPIDTALAFARLRSQFSPCPSPKTAHRISLPRTGTNIADKRPAASHLVPTASSGSLAPSLPPASAGTATPPTDRSLSGTARAGEGSSAPSLPPASAGTAAPPTDRSLSGTGRAGEGSSAPSLPPASADTATPPTTRSLSGTGRAGEGSARAGERSPGSSRQLRDDALRAGLSPSRLSHLRGLASLPAPILALVNEAAIDTAHASELSRLKSHPEEQIRLALLSTRPLNSTRCRLSRSQLRIAVSQVLASAAPSTVPQPPPRPSDPPTSRPPNLQSARPPALSPPAERDLLRRASRLRDAIASQPPDSLDPNVISILRALQNHIRSLNQLTPQDP